MDPVEGMEDVARTRNSWEHIYFSIFDFTGFQKQLNKLYNGIGF